MDKVNGQRARTYVYGSKCLEVVQVQDMDHTQWCSMCLERKVKWLYLAVCRMLDVGSCHLNWGPALLHTLKRTGSQSLFLALVEHLDCHGWDIYRALWRLKLTRHSGNKFLYMMQAAKSRHRYYITRYPWYRLTYEYIIKVTGMTSIGGEL